MRHLLTNICTFFTPFHFHQYLPLYFHRRIVYKDDLLSPYGFFQEFAFQSRIFFQLILRGFSHRFCVSEAFLLLSRWKENTRGIMRNGKRKAMFSRGRNFLSRGKERENYRIKAAFHRTTQTSSLNALFWPLFIRRFFFRLRGKEWKKLEVFLSTRHYVKYLFLRADLSV